MIIIWWVVDWRADQRIALSDVPGDAENNGLHELRYDDDRYLPFEGTGAVATWRLELPVPRHGRAAGHRPVRGLPERRDGRHWWHIAVAARR